MYLTVTVDTEEDNWGEFGRSSFTVSNVRRIPRIQELFERYGVAPAYLISYPVATSSEGVEILGRYLQAGTCEIGAHPHPSNTPPLEEEPNEINSYICNLPSSLQFRKIEQLTQAIESRFGVRPATYRSGRWGFSEEIAGHLIRLGYKVDTSVFPVWNWSPGPDFRKYSPEPFIYEARCETGGVRRILEIPATVDFLQSRRALATSVFSSLDRMPMGGVVLGGLKRLRALNRVCLSPEVAEVPDMIRLADAIARRGGKVVNFFFHSPTLLEGCTPFTRTAGDVAGFIARIEGFLKYAKSAGFVPVTPSCLTEKDAGATRVRTITTEKRPGTDVNG
jgi:hypothetical protein